VCVCLCARGRLRGDAFRGVRRRPREPAARRAPALSRRCSPNTHTLTRRARWPKAWPSHVGEAGSVHETAVEVHLDPKTRSTQRSRALETKRENWGRPRRGPPRPPSAHLSSPTRRPQPPTAPPKTSTSTTKQHEQSIRHHIRSSARALPRPARAPRAHDYPIAGGGRPGTKKIRALRPPPSPADRRRPASLTPKLESRLSRRIMPPFARPPFLRATVGARGTGLRGAYFRGRGAARPRPRGVSGGGKGVRHAVCA
jgi:hypothetical protein